MQNKSILLVDDEKIILNSIGMDLRQENYDVTLASSGEEAISLLKARHFDLVVTDLSMFGMDGIKVLKEAKNISSLTGVIILTGYGDMTSAIDALRLGADDYLLKPCEPEELILRIERCLEKRCLVEQLRIQNQKLAESELQKTLLLNSAGTGICEINTQGRIVFINPAAEKMLGYTAAEIVGKSSHSLIHHTRSDGSSYSKEECLIYAAIEKKEANHVTDELLWRKDGTNFSVEYSSTPIMHSNKVVGAVVIFTDLTEKKKQENNQRQVEVYLQQLQKFQSLNSMAAGIAHNFNNILTCILGNQELALDSMPTHQKERAYVEAAFEASQRAAKISTMMLQFVGQAKREMQQFEMTELIKEMIVILSLQIKSSIELCLDSSKDVLVKADIGMIRQIIVNLVSNAAESIGEKKGKINLQHGQRFYTEKELKQPYMQAELQAGEYVYLTVMDNGPGMKKEELIRACEPFFTTKFTGRGMGLASIIGIMRIHYGTVILESKPGKGFTATVLFPALSPHLIVTDQSFKSVPVEESFTGTVLFVDDEQALCELGKDILDQMGFNVLQAADGLEALDLFEKHMKVIDLVLLDIAMPRLDGIGALNKIREKSTVPVIIATGYTIEQVSDQFNNIVNVSLLQKPYGPKELRQKIHEIISHA